MHVGQLVYGVTSSGAIARLSVAQVIDLPSSALVAGIFQNVLLDLNMPSISKKNWNESISIRNYCKDHFDIASFLNDESYASGRSVVPLFTELDDAINYSKEKIAAIIDLKQNEIDELRDKLSINSDSIVW